MRKMTLEIEPTEIVRESLGPMYEKLVSYEILEALKINYEEGICVDLIELVLREGVSIDDLGYVGNMEILSVLRSEECRHTCIVKYNADDEDIELFKEFDLDLITTTPNLISKEKIVCSMIGDQKNLARFVELIRTNVGEIKNMSFKKAVYQRQEILSVLTEKQRNVLITAHQCGYYDYPKKINSKKLSEKVNISKPTLVQHLRKAEGRILGEILSGY